MNFQNDEQRALVRVIQEINHTRMIVVIPKSTQRIDFPMTFIMINRYSSIQAHLKLQLGDSLPFISCPIFAGHICTVAQVMIAAQDSSPGPVSAHPARGQGWVRLSPRADSGPASVGAGQRGTARLLSRGNSAWVGTKPLGIADQKPGWVWVGLSHPPVLGTGETSPGEAPGAADLDVRRGAGGSCCARGTGRDVPGPSWLSW